MKKIVGTIAAIALAASSAFAGVNVGMGFNRALFTPFAIGSAEGSKAEMSTCVSWGGAPRVGVSFSAAGEQIGVVGDIKLDGNAVAVNDNAYIWIKPFSWLKVQIGQSFEDSLRGSMCFGTWDWLRQWGVMTGDDLTFTRMADVKNSKGSDESTALLGAIIALTPIEGLNINVGLKTGAVDTDIGKESYVDKDGNTVVVDKKQASYGACDAEKVFKNIQVQVGYAIPNVAQIKAQYIGMGDHGIINAAVGINAVEDMKLEVGAFIDTKEKEDIVIGAIWGMPVGPVNLNANVKFAIPTDSARKADLVAGVGAGFDCGNGLGVTADVRVHQSFAEGAKTDLGFGLYADKWLGNGSVGVGFEGAVNGTSIAGTNAAGDFKMAIPVRVQCFF